MSPAARSLAVFAVYLVVLGLVLLLAPDPFLRAFGLPPTEEVWIRVVGMLLLYLAFYYSQAARAELAEFFRWTVYVRASIILFCLGFVALGLARPVILLFGGLDLLAALWTALALRASPPAARRAGRRQP